MLSLCSTSCLNTFFDCAVSVCSAVHAHAAGKSIHGVAVGLACWQVIIKLELLLLRNGLLRDDLCEALEAGCLQPC